MRELILWNEASQKWQDPYNDYWCSGKTVRARYGFPDKTRVKEFNTSQEAMQFYVNLLFTKATKHVVD